MFDPMYACGYVIMTPDNVRRAARLNLIDIVPAQEFDLPHYWTKYAGYRVIEVQTIGL